MDKNLRTNVIVAVVSALVAAVIAVLVTSNSVTSTPMTSNGEAVVASTSLGEITTDELYEELKGQAGFNVLLTMVDDLLIADVQELTDEMKEEAQSSIDDIKAQYGDQFETVLEQNGFNSEQDLLDAFLSQIRQNAYIEAVVSEDITDEEIQAAYDAIEPQIKASHILIKPTEDSEEALAAALEVAQGLIGDLNEGADFAELASEYSEDTGSAVDGGNLGFFGKGQMVAEFEEAAFALEVGEFTAAPVQSQFGYHIILKTEEEEKSSLEDMRAEIVSGLVATQLQVDAALSQTILKELRDANDLVIQDSVLQAIYETYLSQFEQ
jgi:foldase protein PrsA